MPKGEIQINYFQTAISQKTSVFEPRRLWRWLDKDKATSNEWTALVQARATSIPCGRFFVVLRPAVGHTTGGGPHSKSSSVTGSVAGIE